MKSIFQTEIWYPKLYGETLTRHDFVSIYYLVPNFISFYSTIGNYRSLRFESLWSKCTMQQWHLHVFARVPGWSLCRLSSRVCHEHRLRPRPCMHSQQMHGSLSEYMWSKCIMLRVQSCTYVHLSSRNGWQCLCSMFSRRYKY